MRLLLDQCLARSAAGLLRDRNHDAIHAGESDLSTASDASILEFARQEDRIVVTLDADFHAILALSEASGPSVIRVRIERLRAEAMAELIDHVCTRCEGAILRGAAISVTPDRIRVRRLPIAR